MPGIMPILNAKGYIIAVTLFLVCCWVNPNDAIPYRSRPRDKEQADHRVSRRGEAGSTNFGQRGIGQPDLAATKRSAPLRGGKKRRAKEHPRTPRSRNKNVNVNINTNAKNNPFERLPHRSSRVEQTTRPTTRFTRSGSDLEVRKGHTAAKILLEKLPGKMVDCPDTHKESDRYSSSFGQNSSSLTNARTMSEDDFQVAGELNTKKTSSVHVGEDITLCWIETTTIKEDYSMNPVQRLVIREYTISFENSATIPQRYLECVQLEGEINNKNSTFPKSALFEVMDEDTRHSRVVNFTTVSHSENLTVWQHKRVRCGVGPVVTKTIIEWTDDRSENPKKRVEIKVSPKVHRLTAEPTSVEPCTTELVEPQITSTTSLPAAHPESTDCVDEESCAHSTKAEEVDLKQTMIDEGTTRSYTSSSSVSEFELRTTPATDEGQEHTKPVDVTEAPEPITDDIVHEGTTQIYKPTLSETGFDLSTTPGSQESQEHSVPPVGTEGLDSVTDEKTNSLESTSHVAVTLGEAGEGDVLFTETSIEESTSIDGGIVPETSAFETSTTTESSFIFSVTLGNEAIETGSQERSTPAASDEFSVQQSSDYLSTRRDGGTISSMMPTTAITRMDVTEPTTGDEIDDLSMSDLDKTSKATGLADSSELMESTEREQGTETTTETVYRDSEMTETTESRGSVTNLPERSSTPTTMSEIDELMSTSTPSSNIITEISESGITTETMEGDVIESDTGDSEMTTSMDNTDHTPFEKWKGTTSDNVGELDIVTEQMEPGDFMTEPSAGDITAEPTEDSERVSESTESDITTSMPGGTDETITSTQCDPNVDDCKESTGSTTEKNQAEEGEFEKTTTMPVVDNTANPTTRLAGVTSMKMTTLEPEIPSDVEEFSTTEASTPGTGDKDDDRSRTSSEESTDHKFVTVFCESGEDCQSTIQTPVFDQTRDQTDITSMVTEAVSTTRSDELIVAHTPSAMPTFEITSGDHGLMEGDTTSEPEASGTEPSTGETTTEVSTSDTESGSGQTTFETDQSEIESGSGEATSETSKPAIESSSRETSPSDVESGSGQVTSDTTESEIDSSVGETTSESDKPETEAGSDEATLETTTLDLETGSGQDSSDTTESEIDSSVGETTSESDKSETEAGSDEATLETTTLDLETGSGQDSSDTTESEIDSSVGETTSESDKSETEAGSDEATLETTTLDLETGSGQDSSDTTESEIDSSVGETTSESDRSEAEAGSDEATLETTTSDIETGSGQDSSDTTESEIDSSVGETTSESDKSEAEVGSDEATLETTTPDIETGIGQDTSDTTESEIDSSVGETTSESDKSEAEVGSDEATLETTTPDIETGIGQDTSDTTESEIDSSVGETTSESDKSETEAGSDEATLETTTSDIETGSGQDSSDTTESEIDSSVGETTSESDKSEAEVGSDEATLETTTPDIETGIGQDTSDTTESEIDSSVGETTSESDKSETEAGSDEATLETTTSDIETGSGQDSSDTTESEIDSSVGETTSESDKSEAEVGSDEATLETTTPDIETGIGQDTSDTTESEIDSSMGETTFESDRSEAESSSDEATLKTTTSDIETGSGQDTSDTTESEIDSSVGETTSESDRSEAEAGSDEATLETTTSDIETGSGQDSSDTTESEIDSSVGETESDKSEAEAGSDEATLETTTPDIETGIGQDTSDTTESEIDSSVGETTSESDKSETEAGSDEATLETTTSDIETGSGQDSSDTTESEIDSSVGETTSESDKSEAEVGSDEATLETTTPDIETGIGQDTSDTTESEIDSSVGETTSESDKSEAEAGSDEATLETTTSDIESESGQATPDTTESTIESGSSETSTSDIESVSGQASFETDKSDIESSSRETTSEAGTSDNESSSGEANSETTNSAIESGSSETSTLDIESGQASSETTKPEIESGSGETTSKTETSDIESSSSETTFGTNLSDGASTTEEITIGSDQNETYESDGSIETTTVTGVHDGRRTTIEDYNAKTTEATTEAYDEHGIGFPTDLIAPTNDSSPHTAIGESTESTSEADFIEQITSEPPTDVSTDCEIAGKCDTTEMERYSTSADSTEVACDDSSTEMCTVKSQQPSYTNLPSTTETTPVEQDLVSTTVENSIGTTMEAPSSAPPTKHKLALRIQILLEHIDENKNKQKLVEVEKHLLFNEQTEEHGNQSLMGQINALNNSVDMQTVHTLFNCSSLERLTGDIGAFAAKYIAMHQDQQNVEGADSTVTDPENSHVRKRRDLSHLKQQALDPDVEMSLPGIHTDIHSGLSHVMSLVSLGNDIERWSAGLLEVPRSRILEVVADPRDTRIHKRRKRHTIEDLTIDKQDLPKDVQEVGQWSNERVKRALSSGHVRTLTEFTIYKGP